MKMIFRQPFGKGPYPQNHDRQPFGPTIGKWGTYVHSIRMVRFERVKDVATVNVVVDHVWLQMASVCGLVYLACIRSGSQGGHIGG